jgi:hypothetical protein
MRKLLLFYNHYYIVQLSLTLYSYDPARQKCKSREGMPGGGIDWPKVERWQTAVEHGASAELRDAFALEGARGPEIDWRPGAEQLSPRQLRFLFDYWEELRADRAMPLVAEIDPLAMKPALGYIMLVDPEADGDFRYRLYGSRIAAISGFDLTGKRLSEHPASVYLTEFTLALYGAVRRRALPVFTMHGPNATQHTAAWHRIVLPLADAVGAVARLLVGTVPIAFDGKPL